MRAIVSVLFAGALLTACQKPAPPSFPPPEVAVITVAPKTVEENLEFVGEVQAYRSVQVRAHESGVIVARPFREGADVRAGELLYRIDPTASDAEWRGAKARLAEAQARLANSETNAGRLRPLLEGNAVARQDVDNAESAVTQARAAVDDARAAVDRAKKSLDEATVRAEIGGRVGRAMLDVGTRVTGPGDVLTTIDVLDPIYVSFRPSAQQQVRWRQDPRARRVMGSGGTARVEAKLPDGGTFPGVGRIGFVDPVVDAQTGTQQYRAEFTNPNRLLLPGQFVHVQVHGLVLDSAIVVPQRAVLQQMGREIVYVVGKGDTVTAREVKATDWSGGDWLIEEGLVPGERVIVDGLQKVGPGRVVRPVAADTSAKGNDAPGATSAPTSTPASAPAKPAVRAGAPK